MIIYVPVPDMVFMTYTTQKWLALVGGRATEKSCSGGGQSKSLKLSLMKNALVGSRKLSLLGCREKFFVCHVQFRAFLRTNSRTFGQKRD